MPGIRKIDYVPTKEREGPLRVIVLGLPRTGTTSICAALRKLSYKPHSMRDVLADPDSIQIWDEAATLTLLSTADRPMRKRNRNIFPPYGRADFDKLLGPDRDAFADFPSALFPEALVQAYPEAKIIVTKRPYEEWEASMQHSVWLLLTWKLFVVARILNVTTLGPLARLMHQYYGIHNGNNYGGPKAREAYEKYYEDVFKLVPEEKRLTIEAGQGDWGALCGFLDVKMKDREGLGAYPDFDEGASMEKGFRTAWWEVMNWILLMLFVVLTSIAGFVAIYWQRELWAMFETSLKVFEPWVGFGDFARNVSVVEGKDEL